MAKRSITREELEAHKSEHIGFLIASARSFDAGHLGEAKRMAVSLRVLLHHTAKSNSLLGQLGERQREMMDSGFPYDPENLLTHHGLVGLRLSSSGTFFAPLGDWPNAPRMTKFSSWWDADVVLKDTSGATYTRRQLVLFASNKDGGAHVDPHLDERFDRLKDGTGTGWIFLNGKEEVPIPDVIAYSIRQITFEVLKTLGAAIEEDFG